MVVRIQGKVSRKLNQFHFCYFRYIYKNNERDGVRVREMETSGVADNKRTPMF